MSHRATVTLEWLRKGRPLDDSTIIRNIMLDAAQEEVKSRILPANKKKEHKYLESLARWQENLRLDPILFEREFGLLSLDEGKVSYKAIEGALQCSTVHQEVSRRESPLIPSGDTLREQVLSLLPACMVKTLSKRKQKQEYMKQKQESLVYFLSRVILNSMPNSKGWPVVPIGLDSLSAGLFTLQFISQAANTRIQWLVLIWRYEIERFRNELLLDLLGSLSHEITAGEVLQKLESANYDVKMDLGPRDPIVGWIHDWQNKMDEYKPNMTLVDCYVAEEKEDKASRDTRSEASKAARKKPATTNMRRILKQDLLELLSGGVQTPQTPLPRSIWAQTRLTADGPLSYMHEGLLSSARAGFNILRFKQLMRTCEYLAEIEQPGKPTRKEIASASGIGVRSAQVDSIRFTLTERYIPSLIEIGLRYRFIFTPMQKSAVDSIGLAERLHITESDQFQFVTKHLEPIESQGPLPSDLPENCFQTVVDSDVISMRLDLFNEDLGDWSREPWTAPSTSESKNQWLIREAVSRSKQYSVPTQREIDLLSLLSGIRTSSKGVKWLLNSIKFPPRTAKHLLSQLLGTQKLRLLYHPSLDYAGLPEGLLIAAQFKSPKQFDSFNDWLVASFPFVHSQFNRKEKSIVSQVRVPRFSKSEGLIKQKLQKDKALKVIGTIARNRTYHMSAFHRLYQSKSQPWLDPWLDS